MKKLTVAQVVFLQEAWENRHDHGAGNGAQVWNKWDQRIANNLERAGLISQPPGYTRLLGAHLTEAGRKALGH